MVMMEIDIPMKKLEDHEVIGYMAERLNLKPDKYIKLYDSGAELKQILDKMDYERNHLDALVKKQADKAINPKKGEKMNVYVFSQREDPLAMYTAFTVAAKSEDDAWRQIKALFKGKHEWDKFSPDSFVNNRPKYKVVKLDLNAPKVIAHYSQS